MGLILLRISKGRLPASSGKAAGVGESDRRAGDLVSNVGVSEQGVATSRMVAGIFRLANSGDGGSESKGAWESDISAVRLALNEVLSEQIWGLAESLFITEELRDGKDAGVMTRVDVRIDDMEVGN